MFGPNPELSPLASRKRLLLAESELNRAQLVGDMADMDAGLRKVGDRTRSFQAVASSAAVLLAAFAASQRGASADTASSHPWLRKLLKGAGLVSTVWLAFRTSRPARENTRP